MKTLTKKDARKVLAVIDNPKGLTSGLGKPKPGQMCVMAAINYALGNEHGDSPDCVHPVIRAFDITLNDSKWSSNEACAKGMRREAIAKLGSTEIDVQKWINYVSEQTIRRVLPKILRDLAVRYPKNAEAWNRAADKCEAEGTQESAEYAAEYAADSYLIIAAEIATEACILCGTQGSKWLDIVEEAK